jgi:hypothetical protein
MESLRRRIRVKGIAVNDMSVINEELSALFDQSLHIFLFNNRVWTNATGAQLNTFIADQQMTIRPDDWIRISGCGRKIIQMLNKAMIGSRNYEFCGRVSSIKALEEPQLAVWGEVRYYIQPRTFRIDDSLGIQESGLGSRFRGFSSSGGFFRLQSDKRQRSDQGNGLCNSDPHHPPFGSYILSFGLGTILFDGGFLLALCGAFLIFFGYGSKYRIYCCCLGGLLFVAGIAGELSASTALFFGDPSARLPRALRTRYAPSAQNNKCSEDDLSHGSDTVLHKYLSAPRMAGWYVAGDVECPWP